MKRLVIGLVIMLLSSMACQHPSLVQAAISQAVQAVYSTTFIGSF